MIARREFCPRQAVILCGGLGSRLGDLTAHVPKPLLTVGDDVFLDHLICELRRFGFSRVLLLAGHMADQIKAFASSRAADIHIEVSVEPLRAGTGGALWHARAMLDDVFLLLNGDSWFDINLLDLTSWSAWQSWADVSMALRVIEDPGRFGTVHVRGDRVASLQSNVAGGGPGLINAGIYVVRRNVVEHIGPNASLETEVLPSLISSSRVAGKVYAGFFIDIGIPASFHDAQTSVLKQRRRPAVFLDRDGVLNVDHGYVGTIDRFDWIPEAISAVKLMNDLGLYVFVVTNQAGVAHGFYEESQIETVHAHLQADLRAEGAHIDDFRYCPHHPDAKILPYRDVCECRKPSDGMIRDLLARWPVDLEASILFGDKESDLNAGREAGCGRVVLVGPGLSLMDAFLQEDLCRRSMVNTKL